jgi:hypothetical protein
MWQSSAKVPKHYLTTTDMVRSTLSTRPTFLLMCLTLWKPHLLSDIVRERCTRIVKPTRLVGPFKVSLSWWDLTQLTRSHRVIPALLTMDSLPCMLVLAMYSLVMPSCAISYGEPQIMTNIFHYQGCGHKVAYCIASSINVRQLRRAEGKCKQAVCSKDENQWRFLFPTLLFEISSVGSVELEPAFGCRLPLLLWAVAGLVVGCGFGCVVVVVGGEDGEEVRLELGSDNSGRSLDGVVKREGKPSLVEVPALLSTPLWLALGLAGADWRAQHCASNLAISDILEFAAAVAGVFIDALGR